MSLVCVGQYVDHKDSTSFCFENSLVFLGFNEEEAEEMLKAFASLPIGTPVAIKSFSPTEGLTIKGLGIISSSTAITIMYNGKPRLARNVKFVSKESTFFGKPKDMWGNMRNGSLYYEMNQAIIREVLKQVKDI
jgi:hypothetical protein